MENIDFWLLLQKTQEYLSRNYAAVLTDRDKSGQLKNYIDKYLRDNNYHADGMDTNTLINRLYREMAEYSILTPFLGLLDLEEINVNGWDDIALTYLDGSIRKLDEHFHSPQHAVDVIKRLLHHSGMVIDNATPIAQGHLPGNTRITTLKAPIVDDERGVAVSIRLLHPQRVDINNLIGTGFATEEMVAFLCMCIRYGVPFVVAGATSSGKTTFLNVIMSSIPDSKRVFTIESGSREFSLIHRDSENKVRNNIVNTLSRPSDNPAYDITQEDLVVASLRFDPDYCLHRRDARHRGLLGGRGVVYRTHGCFNRPFRTGRSGTSSNRSALSEAFSDRLRHVAYSGGADVSGCGLCSQA